MWGTFLNSLGNDRLLDAAHESRLLDLDQGTVGGDTT